MKQVEHRETDRQDQNIVHLGKQNLKITSQIKQDLNLTASTVIIGHLIQSNLKARIPRSVPILKKF